MARYRHDDVQARQAVQVEVRVVVSGGDNAADSEADGAAR
jgi:hypothetical protein